eukprot:GHRR01022388.1.p1 GENE.GHRR01022388.1~~GHRR01022388.1.p1  ORF type:complete len:133 (+),score=27.03 GHRR01022388.1:298-696(+)
MASSNLGLVPYQLSCKHGPLSAELGPPDYYPVVRGQCPEDTLNGTTAVSGYKWVPESLRINEGNESLLSLTCHNAAYWDERNTYALRQVSNITASLAAAAERSHLTADKNCVLCVCAFSVHMLVSGRQTGVQ